MRFDVLTLFPELIDNVTSSSIIGRAKQAGIIQINSYNIRDWSRDKHRRVDDTPYGGGMGMLMAAPPINECYTHVKKLCDDNKKTKTIYMSPKGKLLTQDKARELSNYDRLIILCGHYEGIDQRIIDTIVDEEISIGNYVLTGGELPACILIDSVSRLIDGVLASPECYEKESIAGGVLEYPQYTRPYEFNGIKVPEVLLGGNHLEIEKWRYDTSLELTIKQRPDLLGK